MQQIREEVAAYAAAFDPALMPAPLAQKILEDAIATENMLSTIKALAAKRVADTELWRREGHLSPAHHLARKAGTSVTRAKEALETAARLSQLPALDAAARAGEVSGSQAGPVAEAAAKNPRAELRLVRMAKRGSLGELLDECARTKAAAEPDADARHRAIHASRHLRRRRTADGAGELTYRSTLDEVGELFSIVQGYAQRVFEKARAAGRREPEEAYLADGLLAAARAGAASGRARPGRGTGTGAGGAYGAGRGAAGAGAHSPRPGGAWPASAATGRTGAGAQDIERRCLFPDTGMDTPRGDGDDAGARERRGLEQAGGSECAGTEQARSGGFGCTDDEPLPPPVRPAKVVVRIDWDSLIRGFPIEDEVCEIAGLGPVSVSVVEAMMASGDCFLAAVVTKGVDVANVAHLGRRPNAFQRSALEWLNPVCTAEGCNTAVRLEIDHRREWSKMKVTLLALLDGCCEHHHDLKTYKGWAFVDGSGKRPMVPPWDHRHPRKALAGPAPPEAKGELKGQMA